MPYKTGKMKGELTTPEIRKLIKAHNILVSIKIPKGSKREDIIALIKKNGYMVDHEKQTLRPVSKGKVKKLPVVDMKRAKELTKPKTLTEEEKKKRQQAKQKKAGEKAFLKTVIPKAPPVSKPSKGVKVKKPTQPNKEAPKEKPLPKKEAPKQRRKLKGRLTGVRDKTTEEIEKLFPEFYAEDKELSMKTRGLVYDVLAVYHKIKKEGTAEQKKDARKVYDDFSGYRGDEKSKFNSYKQQFEMILKNDKEQPAIKKVEEKKEVKKVEEKKEEPKKKLSKEEEAFNKSGIIPAVKKQIGKLLEEWEKVRPELLKTLKDKDGNPIKKVKGGKRPLFIREKDKAQKELYKVLKEIYKKGGYAQPSRNRADDLFNLDIQSWEIYGGLPSPQLKKIATDRRNKKIEEIRARKEARKKAEENK